MLRDKKSREGERVAVLGEVTRKGLNEQMAHLKTCIYF